MIAELENMYRRLGYRSRKTQQEEIKLYYKFVQEGFWVCLLIDERNGFTVTTEQHRMMVERVMNLFYHPEGRLEGFPEGIPIYHVECLTIVIGNRVERIKQLCAECDNCWGIQEAERKLLVYENQSGEIFGLRQEIEQLLAQKPLKKKFRQIPYATTAIATINIMVFLVVCAWSGWHPDGTYIAMYGGVFPPYVLERGEWWRIITAMFLHFDMQHLLNNMVIFCCVGSILEKAVGSVKYTVIYFLSGIAGGLLSLFMMVQEQQFAVAAGASGAVFGMIGGLLWVVLRNKGRYSGLTGRGVAFMAILSLYYGFSSAGVDNWAHIGGLLAGFVLTAFLYRRNNQKC